MAVVFLTVAILFTAAALLAVVFDGILDVFDVDLPGDGFFSIVGLAGGLAAFGWVGFATASAGTPTWVQFTSATAALAVVTAAAGFLSRALRRLSGDSSELSSEAMLHQQVTLRTPVAPGTPGLGTVMLGGAVREVQVHCETAMPVGAVGTVKMVLSAGGVMIVPAGQLP